MKKTLFLSLFMALALSASAIPPKKGVKKPILLDNGNTVVAELCGDEFRSYWKAEDGKCYSKDAATGSYHEVDVATFKPTKQALQLQEAALNTKSNFLRKNRVGQKASARTTTRKLP